MVITSRAIAQPRQTAASAFLLAASDPGLACSPREPALTLSTLEARWFFPGLLEETGRGVEAWFRARGGPVPLAWDPAPPAWRRDRYLVIPGHDDMGIKWRDGRLEIKGREAALGPTMFTRGFEGICERWIKWSYAGAAIERRFLGLFRSVPSGVVLVEKRRLQRLLALDAAGDATEIGPDEPRQQGVNLELAQIRVPRTTPETHWSLAFEAFPGDASMAEPFARIVARFLEGCPALPLAPEQSMSYPRWLRDRDRPTPTPG